MTITVDSKLTSDNAIAVQKVCEQFDIDITRMAREIESKIDADLLSLGAEWYREAHAFASGLAGKYNIPLTHAAAVISALSPRTGWVRNKEIAERVIRERLIDGKRVDEIKGALGTNIRMACAILSGMVTIDEVLTGTKRRSFYNNIVTAGTSDDVTVDTWMQRVAMNASKADRGMDLDDSLRFLNARKGKGYVAIAHAVRAVARKLNTSPATVQAAYWIAASGSVAGWHWKGKGLTDPMKY